MDDRSVHLRTFFASYVARAEHLVDPEIEWAFAAVAREPFVSPGLWSIHILGAGYVRTPTDDIAFTYQDTLVALDSRRGDGWWLSTAKT
jgi:protein-L-isoaspartate(D-aspartate) O-methyltransferase